MDTFGAVAENIAGFMQDIVLFIQKVWEYIEKFFGSTEAPEQPLTNEQLF